MAEADERRTVTFDSVPDIEAAEDLFAVAAAMEREAARRYRQLAARMDDSAEPALADLFRRLESMEAGHESGLAAWALRERLTPPPDLSFRWDMPEGISDRALADIGGDLALTPWKALDLAVHNEERAFAFYVRVAAKTRDGRVRAYAERMAQEELEHVALLRLERRRAWRRDHAAAAASRPEIETLDELAAWLSQREAQAAAVLERLAEESGSTGTEGPAAPAVDLRAEARRLGEDYDLLMHIVETSREEALVRAAQDGASRILARLAEVQEALHRLRR